MPLDAAETRQNGPTNEEKLAGLRDYKRLRRVQDEASSAVRTHLKRLKAEGHNTKAVIAAAAAEKRDPDEVKAEIRDTAHLLVLRKVLSFAELLAETDDLNVTQKAQDADDEWDAEDKGYRAGRHGADRAENPYITGTELAVIWDAWWIKGQRAIANEMGPGAKQADASKARPRRGGTTKALAAPDGEEGNGADADAGALHGAKRSRGRPKGSANKKPRTPKAAKERAAAAEPLPEVPSVTH